MFLAHFGPFFSIFGAKNFFLRKSSSVTHNFIWISNTMSNFRKNLWCNSKKISGEKDGWKDGRTDKPYFIGPFRLPLGVQKLTDIKTYRWTQKQRRKFKKPTLPLANAGPPHRVSSILSTKCGGCHQKGLIVASSHKMNNNNIQIYICQSQFSVLLGKKNNQLKLLFYPLVPANFWN